MNGRAASGVSPVALILVFTVLFQEIWFVLADKAKEEEYARRPYKFQFNIEEHHHRKEEKNDKGIIMGEFGFVTADFFYLTTVYATDEEGKFHILARSRKYIGPPTEKPPTKTLATTRRPPIAAPSPQVGKPFVESDKQPFPVKKPKQPFSGLTGCSSCVVPTKTKKPVLGGNTNDGKPFPEAVGGPGTGGVIPPTRPGIGPSTSSQPGVGGPATSYNPGVGGPATSYKPGVGGPATSYNPGVGGPATSYKPGVGGPATSYKPGVGGPATSYKPGVGGPATSYNPGVGGPATSYKPGVGGPATSYKPGVGGPATSYKPGVGGPATSFKPGVGGPATSLRPGVGGPATSYKPGVGGSTGYFRPGQGIPAPPGSLKPSVSGINVPSISRPGLGGKHPRVEKPTGSGSPGLVKEDLGGPNYKFNYTVGFHGHHEVGYRGGSKEGGYFANHRDGEGQRVVYEANEFGYQPNVTKVRLSDAETPKEETEKDYGLKGYEFKWFN